MTRFTLCVVLLFLCACVPEHVGEAVRDAIAVNEGHMNDGDLPEEARLVAQDNYDLDYDILYSLGEIDDLPPEVAARKAARDAARAEGGSQ